MKLFDKLKRNKRGAAYWFIYSIMFLFILTILYIIFNETLQVYLYPTTVQITGGHTTEADKWLSFWYYTPFILVGIVIIFMFFRMTQRDSQGE